MHRALPQALDRAQHLARFVELQVTSVVIVDLPAWSFGYVNLLVVAIVAPFAIIAARFGAKLAGRVERDKLIRVFALLLIVVGSRLLLSLFFAV